MDGDDVDTALAEAEKAVEAATEAEAEAEEEKAEEKDDKPAPEPIPFDPSNMEIDMDDPATLAACRTIQGLFRSRRARANIRLLIRGMYSMVWDESQGSYYFWNRRTGEVKWTKPALLGGENLVRTDFDEDGNEVCYDDLGNVTRSEITVSAEQQEKAAAAAAEANAEAEAEAAAAAAEAEAEAEEAARLAAIIPPRVMPEIPDAPAPGTNANMRAATKACFGRDPRTGGATNCRLVRYDVYTVEDPQRYAFVRADQDDPPNVSEKHPIKEPWEHVFSFFAYNEPVHGATLYIVYDKAEKDGTQQRYKIDVDTKSLGAAELLRRRREEEFMYQQAGAAAVMHRSGWRERSKFYAFFGPKLGTICFHLQEGLNPLRHRVTRDASVRGGWMTCAVFYAYPGGRWAVQDNMARLDLEDGDGAGEGKELDHDEDDEEMTAYEKQLAREFRAAVRLRHRFKIFPAPPPADPPEEDGWRHKCFFYAFELPVPCAVRFNVLRLTGRSVGVDPPDLAPMERWKVAPHGPHSGWALEHHFYAFDMPVPGTTRYNVSVTRKPTRYQVGSQDPLRPWRFLYSFFAYSARRRDEYDWIFHEDVSKWGSSPKRKGPPLPLLKDAEGKGSDDDDGGGSATGTGSYDGGSSYFSGDDESEGGYSSYTRSTRGSSRR